MFILGGAAASSRRDTQLRGCVTTLLPHISRLPIAFPPQAAAAVRGRSRVHARRQLAVQPEGVRTLETPRTGPQVGGGGGVANERSNSRVVTGFRGPARAHASSACASRGVGGGGGGDVVTVVGFMVVIVAVHSTFVAVRWKTCATPGWHG